MLCGASPALAEIEPRDLAAYVRARAADADGNASTAAAGYAIALDSAPENGVIAIRAYRAAISTGDFALLSRARQLLEKADLAPGDAALLALAEAARKGDASATKAAIDRIASGPLDFLTPSLRAWAAIDDPKAAFAALDAVGSNPIARRYAQENRALLLIALGKAAEGTALLQALLGADRGNVDLRVSAAGLLATLGHPDAARQMLATIDPRLATTPLNGSWAMVPTTAAGMSRILARLVGDLGDSQSARLGIAIARASLRLEPGNDRAKLLLASAIGQGEAVGDALAIIDDVSTNSPYQGQAQALRITLLDKSGREAAAIASAEALANAADASLVDLRRYADLLTAASQFERAVDVYRRVAARDPAGADWVVHLQIGSALERIGRWPQAKAALQKAVELAPDQPVALNYLGYSLLEHGGDTAAARKLLERAAMLKPDDLSILDSLAWAYFVDGEAMKALPLLEKAAKGEPGNLTINEHLGDVYWRVGRRYEARYAWRAASGLAAGADEARLASKIANGPPAR